MEQKTIDELERVAIEIKQKAAAVQNMLTTDEGKAALEELSRLHAKQLDMERAVLSLATDELAMCQAELQRADPNCPEQLVTCRADLKRCETHLGREEKEWQKREVAVLGKQVQLDKRALQLDKLVDERAGDLIARADDITRETRHKLRAALRQVDELTIQLATAEAKHAETLLYKNREMSETLREYILPHSASAKALQRVVDKLREELEQLQTEQKRCNDQLQSCQQAKPAANSCDEERKEADDLRAQMALLDDRIRQFKQRETENKQKITELEDELDEMATNARSWSSEANSALAEVAALQRKLDQATSAARASQAAHDALGRQLGAMTTAKDEWERKAREASARQVQADAARQTKEATMQKERHMAESKAQQEDFARQLAAVKASAALTLSDMSQRLAASQRHVQELERQVATASLSPAQLSQLQRIRGLVQVLGRPQQV